MTDFPFETIYTTLHSTVRIKIIIRDSQQQGEELEQEEFSEESLQEEEKPQPEHEEQV